MRLLGLVVFGLCAWPLSGAEVYRSLDQDGNVVYSDRPEGISPELVVISTYNRPASRARVAPPAAAAPARNSEDTAAPPTEMRRVEPTAEEREQRCVVARERVERYRNAHRLYRTGADGEREYLNDSQIDEARAKAAADVDNWCS